MSTVSDIPSDRTLIDALSSSPHASSSSTHQPTPTHARLSSPDLSSFLTSLTSLSLPALLSQPTILASEAAQLTNSLTNLCNAEYTTFLSLHSTSAVLSSSLDALGNSLNSLLGEALPALEERTRGFVEETEGVRERRRKARVVLEREDALMDVLEIPALIETCVRNGHYQEALDLAAHARNLATTIGSANDDDDEPTGDVLLVRAIADDAEQALYQMRVQLLALLHAPAKLPALYKAISFLRKMDANFAPSTSSSNPLTVPELALAFLTGRLAYLATLLASIEKTSGGEGVEVDHARYLRRYMDVWREGVHDLVTQYTSIFLDRTLHSFSQEAAASKANALHEAHKHDATLHLLLATGCQDLLSTHLLPTLAAHLPPVPDALALSALLTQLTHCSAGCARLGMDFRASLPPLFERAVLGRFETALEKAVGAFVNSMADAVKYRRTPGRWLLTNPSADVDSDKHSSRRNPSSINLRIPPPQLALYRPLAALTNAILEALNSLRLLAPTTLLHPLLRALDSALLRASGEFLSYCQQVVLESKKSPARGARGKEEEDGERKADQLSVVKGAGRSFTGVLIPFVRRGLAEGVYGVEGGVEPSAHLSESLAQWDEWIGDETPEGS